MIVSDEFQMHLTLKRLIEEKSKRDNVKFTACQLAQAIGIPRSIITKLTHTEKSKRVVNPRIDTLIKILDFFRADGFSITLEDLIGNKGKEIDYLSSIEKNESKTTTIPLYGLNHYQNGKLGTIEIKLNSAHENAFALYAETEIVPLFKAGSVFIIDPDFTPTSDTLIAVKIDEKVCIKKYSLSTGKILLKSLNQNETDIQLMPTMSITILGAVIQVNVKP